MRRLMIVIFATVMLVGGTLFLRPFSADGASCGSPMSATPKKVGTGEIRYDDRNNPVIQERFPGELACRDSGMMRLWAGSTLLIVGGIGVFCAALFVRQRRPALP